MQIGFHGAAGCVTGSRFLVEAGRTRVLVDCGLFQGYKVLRERNRKPLPFEPSSLDAVLLTHAHIDHSGFLPVLVREGFRGPILTTAATRDLCGILLPDSGAIQEQDAEYANRKGFSKHRPALPLYTERDARRVLPHVRPIRLHEEVAVGDLRARFHDAGHILGAASIEVRGDGLKVLFSGDLGRDDDVLMTAPEPPGAPDWVVMESTYGDRLHPAEDPFEALAAAIEPTLQRGGVVLIPSFAVGRTQAMVYALFRLFESGRLRRVPVHVDSPMAQKVTDLYMAHAEEHRLSEEKCRRVCEVASYARSVEDSKALDRSAGPRVIVSASGMLTGGRVLHHLKVFGPGAENLIVFAGFQAPGTRGGKLVNGASEVKVHGELVRIRAEVKQLTLYSAHADQAGLLGWLGRCEGEPRVVLVHGEPEAQDTLRLKIRDELKLDAHVADYGEVLKLT